MRLLHLLAVIAGVALATPVLAQPFPSRLGSVATDSTLLDEAAVNLAADRLADVGVEALALLLEAPVGVSLADAEAYLDAALERYGFSGGDAYLVVFVGLQPLPASEGTRPLIVDYGAPLVGILERTSNGLSLVDSLYDDLLVPMLQAGDTTGAFTATFDRVAEALAQEQGSPEPNPTAPGRRGNDSLTTTLALLVALGLAAVAWWWYRRNRGKREVGGPGTELERVKGALSKLLIDLSGQDDGGDEEAFLPPDPERQTDFVLIRSFYGETRPEQSQELAARYRAASESLQGVEEGFNALRSEEEAARPTPEAVDSLLARYRTLLTEAEAVRGFTRELADIWKQLQSQTEAVPGRLEDLRDAVASAGERLAARGSAWPSAGALFGTISTAIAEAETEFGADRALEASRILDLAAADLQAIDAGLQRLTGAKAALTDLDVQLDTLRQAGFAIDRFASRREDLDVALGATAAALAKPTEKTVAAVSEVVRTVEELVSEAEAWPELQRQNAERVTLLRRRGEAATEAIERGARAFDAVDDFAASNWHDIRGNGSEAQKAADYAFELCEQAAADNALDDEGADYQRASEAIDEAESELDRVDLLVDALVQRLEALHEAKASSRGRLEALEAELADHRAVLARPDVARDVGPGPESDLDQAAALIAKARASLASATADWLTLVADAQAADRHIDRALASIRSEREAMELQRSRVASEAQEATAASSKLENFARIHRHDLSAAAERDLGQARDAFERAERSSGRLAGLEDEALVRALAATAEAYDAAQVAADSAYESADRDFREMETMRADTASAVASAEADLVSFEHYLRRNQMVGQMASVLGDFRSALPRYRGSADRRQLQASRSDAERLQGELSTALREVQRRREAAESALRRQRQRRLEEERRRRAEEQARAAAAWGSRPPAKGRAPAQAPATSGGRPKVRPTPRTAHRGRTSGGWGGKGRKSGGW